MVPEDIRSSEFAVGTKLVFSVHNMYNPNSLKNVGAIRVYIATSMTESYYVN